MPLTNHHDLFRQPNTGDKLTFFQSLLEARDLNADMTLAMLTNIHAELRQRQEGRVYATYARTMASLRHEMYELYQHAVENWQAPGTNPFQIAATPDE